MKKNLKNGLLTAAGFLLVFLIGKCILNQNQELSFWEWILDATSWNHSYLFGWLIMKKRFLICAVISILPALWGWKQFSAISFIGFTVGLFAGEIYHSLFWTAAQHGIPYAWLIWLLSYVISMVAGILLQISKKKK